MIKVESEVSYDEVMNFLVDSRSAELDLDVVADLFDRMIWISSDNGGAIICVRERWLFGEDRVRVEVALRMNEVFPCNSREEMSSVFDRIGERWPDLWTLCVDWLARWDRQQDREGEDGDTHK
jgi:hypothetical protein